jgi:hypothetical protein
MLISSWYTMPRSSQAPFVCHRQTLFVGALPLAIDAWTSESFRGARASGLPAGRTPVEPIPGLCAACGKNAWHTRPATVK